MTEFSDLNLCPINNRQAIVIDGGKEFKGDLQGETNPFENSGFWGNLRGRKPFFREEKFSSLFSGYTSWVASFPVSRRILPDRTCFVTTLPSRWLPPCAAYAAIPVDLPSANV